MPLVYRDSIQTEIRVDHDDYRDIIEGKHPWSIYNPQLVRKKKVESPIRIGADPEFFIGNDKKLVPSCGLIGGDKGKGVPIPGWASSTWLEDNVAVELNTTDPFSSGTEFAHAFRATTACAIKALQDKKLHAIFKPHVTFKPVDLVDPKSMRFGCEPDFCAYTSNQNDIKPIPRPCDVTKFGNTRFAGGHLHVSFKNRDKIPAYAIVMLIDAFIGLPSLCYDKQQARRSAYGLAGLYRTKKYAEDVEGIEYRTLSNFWLPMVNGDSRSYSIIEAMGDTLFSIGRAVQEYPDLLSKLFIRLPLADIQDAINKEDEKQADAIWRFAVNLQEREQTGITTDFRSGLIKRA
jgi:hypothetical protein